MVKAIYIPEILRILHQMRVYGTDVFIEISILERELSKNLVEGRFFSIGILPILCDLGLIQCEQRKYRITELGLYFLELDEFDDVYPNAEQMTVLNHCFFNSEGSTGSSVSYLFSQMRYNKGINTISIQISRVLRQSFEYKLTQVFLQTGVIIIRESFYLVNECYFNEIQRLKHKKTGLSPDYLDTILKKQKDIGDFAEGLCIEYEVNRLNRMNKKIQAKMIKHVASSDVGVGYDIASFDGTSVLLTHDRFIEVKATSSPTIKFYWSKREREVAMKLKDRYWLYIFTGFHIGKPYNGIPKMFQDPIKTVLNDKQFEIEEDTLYIFEKIQSGS